MPFHPNEQKRLVSGPFSPADMLVNSLAKPAPWDSVIDFMCHPDFVGRRLYPRQRTLYKLIFLEIENFTDYDYMVIDEWTRGFINRRDTFGVQPDIMQRVEYLKKHGYRRFPHIQLVLGRRGSKGIIGGGLGAEQMAYFYSLDDWQAHYDIDEGSNSVVSVVATSQSQAQKYQFADIKRTVLRCKYLAPHVATSTDYYLSIRTPSDLRHIAEYKARKINIGHEVATVTAMALSASSAAGRGGAGCANFFDEMAHMVMGTGSVKSGDEIYNAYKPSLDQFSKDGLIVANSSPFCLEPGTRVLTEDLRWVPVGSLSVGDKLIGFDEHFPEGDGRGKGRCWRPAEVTETSVIHAPRFKITMESGKELISTSEHMWLAERPSPKVGKGGNRGRGFPPGWRWWKTADLRQGDRIKSIGTDPWVTDESREAGYLAGIFDGEGHLSTKNGQATLGFSQNPGDVLDHTQKLLANKGFMFRDYVSEYRIHKLYLTGGFPEMMRFLGTVRPVRLLPKLVSRLYGSRIYGRGGKTQAFDRVVSVVRVDDGLVVALGTSTNTLVAEGLLSHNTKIGIFYKLYQDGCVPMKNYKGEWHMATEKSLGIDAEEAIKAYSAEPEMLILQLPSWGLYKDWERGKQLIGVRFKKPVTWPPEGERPENTRMAREEMRNPDKFRVERRGQFAEVEGAYLNPIAVERMFRDPGWRPRLEAQTRGFLTHKYRIHCDPSRVDANFGMAIGHNEIAPCDNCGAMPRQGLTFHECQTCKIGMHWPHVIFDYLHVWKPGSFEPDEDGRRKIDPLVVQDEIKDTLVRFPSTTRITFDQYDTAIPIALLRKEFSPRIQVAEITATVPENQRRMEHFKSILNLGWIHAYNDELYEDGGSLLEMECKFLAERNNKVVKQEFGPVTTKDLFDCVSTVATDLLDDALKRFKDPSLAHPSFGSTDVAGMRGGREFVRMGSAGMQVSSQLGSLGGTNPAREKLSALHDSHPRRDYQPTRAQSIRARGMPRAGGGRRR